MVEPLIVLPDVEAVIGDYLRSAPQLAAIGGQVGEVPGLEEGAADERWPALRIVRFGGRPVLQRPHYIDRALLQLDAWADDKATANDVARTARGLLAIAHSAAHDGAVISHVEIGDLAYDPDDDFTPAKPRYHFDAAVTIRPGPAA